MVLPLFLKSVHSCFRKTSQSIDTIAVVIRMNKKKRSAMILTIATVSLCLVAWLSKPNTTNTIGSIVSGKTAVKEIYNVEKQNTIRETLDEQIAQGSHSENNALMVYNPFGTNTLSMYTYFTTAQGAKISYTIHVEDDKIADFTRTLNSDYTRTHEYQLIGLIPDHENTITLHMEYEDGTNKDVTYTYTCGSLRGNESIQLETKEGSSREELSDGLYVILGNDSDEDDFMYYYDNNGILRGEVPIEGYRSHRLLFANERMYYSISTNKMAEMDALGQITNVFDLGNYDLHHDYVFDDNGDMLILATDTTKDTVEDMIIRLDVSSGAVSQVVDMGDLFPTYKASVYDKDSDELDWTHLNTIQWMGDNEILVSSRETSTIVKITDIYGTPEIAYMMGEKTYWEDSDYADLLLDKANSFTSQTGQHSITYVEDDSLADGQYYLYMFNNNFGYSSTNTAYDWNQLNIPTEVKAEDAVSKYYKYLVDESKGTYELVDTFDVPYSPYVSSVQNIGGNTVVDSGMAFNFQEYDSDHTLIRSFTMEGEKYIYRVYKYTFDGFYFNQ